MGDLQISTWERRLISSANKPETLQDIMMIVMGGSQRPLIGRGSHREEVAGEGRGEGRAKQEHLLLGIRFFTLKHGGTPPPPTSSPPSITAVFASLCFHRQTVGA